MTTELTMTAAHLVGHRGARAEAPENTLGGFRHLRSIGINKVELDIHLSADHKLMVIHDASTLRTTGIDAQVNTLTSLKLQRLNACVDAAVSWPQREPIPELSQVLKEWTHLEHIQIEVKPLEGQHDFENLAQQLYCTCVDLNLSQETTVITSSDQHFIQHSRTINPLPHGLVADKKLTDPLGDAQRLGCTLLALHYMLYTEELAQKCQEAQMPVSLWTVNNPELANALVIRGASSIITDHPSEFLQWISKQSSYR